jgi:superfamily II RNA helicase
VKTPLHQKLAPDTPRDPDTLLELFLGWAAETGYTLYDHQEEAILEIMADRHVILNTPTGSGKSMVALAMHFRAYALGKKSYYTSPIKALVSEKFFDLCKHFGAENVGMMTGDAAINRDAPIICCTAEVLATIALSEGDLARVDYAILDEFHYYADRERGMAWQIPLLALPHTIFMLMSATLGDTADLSARLEKRTRRTVSLVKAVKRPVPLTFEYSEEPLQDTVLDLCHRQRAPIYVVAFTQRECAEQAQNFTSLNLTTKEEKATIAEALRGFRFDTPYGKDVQRFLRQGIGLHHAGLLPKYRLIVEQLAQKGLLKLIFGTDTLAVGINIPLRTVVFTALCKFDGQKTRLLSVRDFHQTAGRAGRKGFDDQGWVVCQAPEHVIENRRMERRAAGDAQKMKKLVRKKAPEKGYVHWDEKVYRELIAKSPEPLTSRFRVEFGMVLNLLQRPRAAVDRHGGYGALIELIDACHETDTTKARLRREAKRLFRLLLDAKVMELKLKANGRSSFARVSRELQRDFSLHHSLSLFLYDTAGRLAPTHPDFAVQVLSFAEAILEDPNVVLFKQQDKAKRDALAEMKQAGIEYEQRMEALEKITWPQPDAELIRAQFEAYADENPWVRVGEPHPKSVARDMYLQFASFNEWVQDFGLQASEGVLLRHLSQVYKTLVQAVPDACKTDELYEIEGYLRSTLERADNSLLQFWQDMVDGGRNEVLPGPEVADLAPPKPKDVTTDKKAFLARIRAEMHAFVKALARMDYDEAALSLRDDSEATGDPPWTPLRIEETMRAYYANYDFVVFDTAARNHANTRVETLPDRQWRVRQVICDHMGDNMWVVEGLVDLRGVDDREGPLVALRDLHG